MNHSLEEHDCVEVVKLLQPNRDYDGTSGVCREPRVGDTGTVVFVLSPRERYIVECVDLDGMTIWLAEFADEELRLFTAMGEH